MNLVRTSHIVKCEEPKLSDVIICPFCLQLLQFTSICSVAFCYDLEVSLLHGVFFTERDKQ
jgi:hypothetical protein